MPVRIQRGITYLTPRRQNEPYYEHVGSRSNAGTTVSRSKGNCGMAYAGWRLSRIRPVLAQVSLKELKRNFPERVEHDDVRTVRNSPASRSGSCTSSGSRIDGRASMPWECAKHSTRPGDRLMESVRRALWLKLRISHASHGRCASNLSRLVHRSTKVASGDFLGCRDRLPASAIRGTLR